MTTDLRIFLIACFVFLPGCQWWRQTSADKTLKKENKQMIKIEDLTLTDKTLTLDYKVSNPFADDIRVFWDTNDVRFRGPAVRIDSETVWIKLRLCLERDRNIYVNPPPIAKYIRLSPNESYPGRLVLNLPIEDTSRPYYSEDPKKHNHVVVHRIVFEVGYFGSKFNKIFESIPDQLKSLGIERGIKVDGPFCYLPIGMAIAEEKQDNGQSYQVTYIGAQVSFLCEEESAKIVIEDVNISCSI